MAIEKTARSSTRGGNKAKGSSATPKNTKAHPFQGSPLSTLPGETRDMKQFIMRPVEERQQEKSKKGGIPRPVNCFMIYRMANYKKLQELNEDSNYDCRNVSTMASHSWKAESDEVQKFYKDLMELEKEQHKLAFPDYKFAVSRRAKDVGEDDKSEDESATSHMAPNPYNPSSPVVFLDDGSFQALPPYNMPTVQGAGPSLPGLYSLMCSMNDEPPAYNMPMEWASELRPNYQQPMYYPPAYATGYYGQKTSVHSLPSTVGDSPGFSAGEMHCGSPENWVTHMTTPDESRMRAPAELQPEHCVEDGTIDPRLLRITT